MRTVPVDEFRPVIEELRRRIGPMEAARRIGMSVEHLSDTRLAEKSSVRGSTYDAAVAVLDEARANGEDGWDVIEVRSRNLIARGSEGYRLERAKFERECERRRTEGKLVKGVFGWMRIIDHFEMADCQVYWRRGFQVPLDLVPIEYWHPPSMPFPRFSEEMLGDEF